MNEQERLDELYKYKILDTQSEKELDELTELASAICDTPISLISFIDEDRQWIKAKKGLSLTQTHREDTFSRYIFQYPDEVLVVESLPHDKRFKNHPFIFGDPEMRFFAGAPLKTSGGYVLGMLCIIDNKPHKITEGQKRALKLLAKKTMDFLELRRFSIKQQHTIELNAAKLKKLTDLAPGAIYQFEMSPDGKMSYPFISKGISAIYPNLNPEDLKNDPELGFKVIHPHDREAVKRSIQVSFLNLTKWNIEFRVVLANGRVLWHWAHANPERKKDGTVVWYGTFQDITERKEYIDTLEQILSDISHVMRRPVVTMLGLCNLIEEESLDENTLKEYTGLIKAVFVELDSYLKKLNESYSKTQQNLYNRNISNRNNSQKA